MASNDEIRDDTRDETGSDDTGPRPPESPSDLPGPSWWAVVKRSVREFREDQLTDWAGALTYYGVLSIFPAMLAVVSILGLFGSRAIEPLVENVSTLAPGPARDILLQALRTMEQAQGGALVFTIIGIAVALWSASGYVAAFMRASNVVYDMPEGRPIWKLLPLRVAVTAVLLVLLAIGAVIVVFTGGLAQWTGQVLGVGDTAVRVWDIAKWPVLVAAVVLMLAILYRMAPNVRHPGFRWLTPGSALAVVLWILASLGFGFYVASFGAYNRTYGAIAGVIIFLIWLWVTNIAVLFGLEVDAELERARAIAAGHPPDKEPYVEPRDTRKFPQDLR